MISNELNLQSCFVMGFTCQWRMMMDQHFLINKWMENITVCITIIDIIEERNSKRIIM